MKTVRWHVLVVTTTILASVAAASDDAASALREASPQEQSQASPSPQTQSPSQDSAAPEQPPREQPSPGLDKRDRIFYPGDTERLKPLGRKLLLNILLDQEEIFTSPFRINRQNAKWWVLFGATTAGLIAADHHIADAFENSRGQVRWGGRISNIGASYTLVLCLLKTSRIHEFKDLESRGPEPSSKISVHDHFAPASPRLDSH